VPNFGFGQSQTGVFQMAYVVEDIQAEMHRWAEHLGAGPWHLIPAFGGVEPSFRGGPTEAEVSLAMGFAGHMCIELIQPLDDKPSVWREGVERFGWGFHHFGIGSLDFDADLARHVGQGHEIVYEAKVPTGGRVAYVDATANLPGYVELCEVDAATDATFSRFYAASVGWDGSEPVRPFA
jgi:glyoxalase/bleomycin resistance protein/dioxygenase superfamily protein